MQLGKFLYRLFVVLLHHRPALPGNFPEDYAVMDDGVGQGNILKVPGKLLRLRHLAYPRIGISQVHEHVRLEFRVEHLRLGDEIV